MHFVNLPEIAYHLGTFDIVFSPCTMIRYELILIVLQIQDRRFVDWDTTRITMCFNGLQPFCRVLQNINKVSCLSCAQVLYCLGSSERHEYGLLHMPSACVYALLRVNIAMGAFVQQYVGVGGLAVHWLIDTECDIYSGFGWFILDLFAFDALVQLHLCEKNYRMAEFK